MCAKESFGPGSFNKVILTELLAEVPLEIEIDKILEFAKIKKETGQEVLEQWLKYDVENTKIILENARLRIINLITFIHSSNKAVVICFSHRILIGLLQTLQETNLLHTSMNDIPNFEYFTNKLIKNIFNIKNTEPISHLI